ncbi:MAG: conserved rane protein of unknown function [Candidatus Saccharibacteria bacterium]|jgi:hypothetical protein|nr:conserved rane protein of unknown function [Candidatus Saccharibacteria bacterium]
MIDLSLLLAAASDQINSSALKACGNSCNTGTSVAGIFAGIANALIFLVGAVSVIMIIVGGLRYVISNGDSKQIAAAKDTILYAVIGIIVAIAAYAIVRFVTTSI